MHDVVAADGDLMKLVRPWGKAKAQQIITQVQADYVAELNRALASPERQMYGIDPETFMRQYDALWSAKLSL